MAALALAPAVARADYPHGPGLAPQESAKLGPVEVCNEMLAASRVGDIDALVARTTIYARQKISSFDRLLIRLGHSRLAESRCVKTTEEKGDQAMVWVYAPNGHSANMPFLREEGVWRFDQQRWEALRHQGKAPKP
ncbi:MAG: hypothetical protein JST54_17460 [Deltaproteobacteria bacterium]|nr:hypothetical protein [Deltaproteobacteria bacterium]